MLRCAALASSRGPLGADGCVALSGSKQGCSCWTGLWVVRPAINPCPLLDGAIHRRFNLAMCHMENLASAALAVAVASLVSLRQLRRMATCLLLFTAAAACWPGAWEQHSWLACEARETLSRCGEGGAHLQHRRKSRRNVTPAPALDGHYCPWRCLSARHSSFGNATAMTGYEGQPPGGSIHYSLKRDSIRKS